MFDNELEDSEEAFAELEEIGAEEDLFDPFNDDDEGETSEIARAATQTPVDLERLARRTNIPTTDQLFNEMIYQVTLLQQTHGDADPALSHVLADLDMGLRSHVETCAHDPLRWLLTVLASMPPDRQLVLVDDAITLLSLRREQLTEVISHV